MEQILEEEEAYCILFAKWCKVVEWEVQTIGEVGLCQGIQHDFVFCIGFI